MTSPIRLERDLPILLEDLYLAGTPDYRDELVQRVAATRQRPAWAFPERWLPMDVATQAVPTARMPWRQLGVLALIALLAAVAVVGYIGSQRRLPEPFGVAANGPIVYADGGDVFLRDTLDDAPRGIVSGPENEVAAWFSPRGDKLLVIRLVDGGETLWVGKPDGSDLIRIGDGPYPAGQWAEFSPDGTIVAVAYAPAGIPTVELLATDGSGSRVLTDMPADSPTFRPPDGRQLLFRAQDPTTGDWGFYLVDVAGGDPVRLAINGDDLEGGGYDLLSPAWSPTGDRLAYHSLVRLPLSVGQTNGFRIFVASIDEAGTVSGILPLEMDPTSDDEMVPVFSQDGRSLVFQQRFGLLGVNDYTDSAWIVGADGTAPRPLGVQTSNGEGFVVSVAPDDTQVLVHLNTERQDWIVPRDGSPAARTDLESDGGAGWRREAS